MAKANGRIYLQTDGGSRALDRLVDREARVTFYPESVTSDRPITVTFNYNPQTDETSVHVQQHLSDGTSRTLMQTSVANRSPLEQARREAQAAADAPTS